MWRRRASWAGHWRSCRPAMRSRWTCRRGASTCTSRRRSSTAAARPGKRPRHATCAATAPCSPPISARPTKVVTSISWPARGRFPSRKFTDRSTPPAEDLMKIGLFDHVEDGERALATLFDERLAFAKAADEAGIYCLHVAEHHATPLNMVPVPGVYLAAVARATKRIRLGPLVYLLPLYSPLRLIEEICILDHLSHGRMEVGVGRGVSPFELKYHKIDHDESRDIFIDAFNCIAAGLTADTLTYSGKYHQYENVPIALRPLQQPHPPFWYGSSNTTGATWAGEHGMHFVSLGPTPFRQDQHRRLQASARKARRAGSAQGRVSRRHGDRRAAPYFRRRYRRGGQALRQAGDGASSGASELAAGQARCDRPDLAAQCAARRDVRGLRGRRVGHRRDAAARAQRDRAAGG